MKHQSLPYINATVAIFCFSLVNKSSLLGIKNTWLEDFQKNCPNIPYILVGTQSELRDEIIANPEKSASEKDNIVTTEEGEEMKNQINAKYYFECSYVKRINTKEAIEAALRVSLENEQEPKTKSHSSVKRRKSDAGKKHKDSDPKKKKHDKKHKDSDDFEEQY